MRKALLVLTLLVVLFIAAAPSTASAAANCHLSMSPTSIGNHPAAQITFDTCTDVDKIEMDYGAPLNGESFTILYCCTNDYVYANTFSGINACGTNGWQSVPANGWKFNCQAGSGTICAAANAQCSLWAYTSTFSLHSGCNNISTGISYRLHRWSTNSWGSYSGPSSGYSYIC